MPLRILTTNSTLNEIEGSSFKSTQVKDKTDGLAFSLSLFLEIKRIFLLETENVTWNR